MLGRADRMAKTIQFCMSEALIKRHCLEDQFGFWNKLSILEVVDEKLQDLSDSLKWILGGSW